MLTMHFKSVDHPKAPPKKGVVRANTIISGYIFEEIPDGKGGVSTKLTVISQNDVKGLVPRSLVNMVAARAPKQWVNNLITACNDYLSGKLH